MLDSLRGDCGLWPCCVADGIARVRVFVPPLGNLALPNRESGHGLKQFDGRAGRRERKRPIAGEDGEASVAVGGEPAGRALRGGLRGAAAS